jgi:hypothetical protein
MDDPVVSYLHDHWAGSGFAVELLEKLATEYSGAVSGQIAQELLQQVRSDRVVLRQLIDNVGKASPDFYDAVGWIAERVSQIKLTHDDPAGFGVFEAYETISLGILGKRGLWEALNTRQALDNRLAGVDYDTLIASADQQFHQANQHRLKLVASALSKQEEGNA